MEHLYDLTGDNKVTGEILLFDRRDTTQLANDYTVLGRVQESAEYAFSARICDSEFMISSSVDGKTALLRQAPRRTSANENLSDLVSIASTSIFLYFSHSINRHR